MKKLLTHMGLLTAVCTMTACDQTRMNAEEPPEEPTAQQRTSAQTTEMAYADKDDRSAEDISSDMLSPIDVELITPSNIRMGEQAVIQFKLTNESDAPLHDVQVIPQENVALSKDITGKTELSKEPLMVGSIPAGNTVTVESLFAADAMGQLEKCFMIDYKTGFCASVTVVKPELEFSRMIVDEDGNEVDEAFICDEVYAVYTVRNVGTGTSDPILITDEFPQGLSVESGRVYREKIDGIEAGDEWEETIELEVDTPVDYQGFAIASVGGNTLQSDKDSVDFYDTQIALNVEGPRNMKMYRSGSYEVSVTNIGDYPALDIEVSVNDFFDEVDEQFNSNDIFDDDLLEIDTLAPGETRTVSFFADYDEVGSYDLVVTADGYCVADVQEAEVVTNVTGVPALRLELIDTVDPVMTGDLTMYRLRVKNQGTDRDTDIRVTAELPSNLEFVEGEGETNVRKEGGNLVFGGVTEIDPEESVEWTFTARAKSASKVITSATLKSGAIKEGVTEEEPTNVVEAEVQ